MHKPPYGRMESMDIVLSRLKEKPYILEIGMTRAKGNWGGDGYSTIIFGYMAAQLNGTLISIDIKSEALLVTSAILREYDIPAKNILLVCADALEYFKRTEFKKVDLLYLDAWDYKGDEQEREASADCHLEALKAVERYLVKGSMVLIDDIMNPITLEGKGKKVIPYMLDNGYTLIYKGYQFLFIR